MKDVYKGAESWDISDDERAKLCSRIDMALGRMAMLKVYRGIYLDNARREKSVVGRSWAAATGEREKEVLRAVSENRLPRVFVFGHGLLDTMIGYVMTGPELTEEHVTVKFRRDTIEFGRTQEAEYLPRARHLPEGGLLSELRIVEFELPLLHDKVDFYGHEPKTHPIRLGQSALEMDGQLQAVEAAFAAFDATRQKK